MENELHEGQAEIVRLPANGAVQETMDRLEAAVVAAGARVFARVDHGAGAASVGAELAASETLIFGNPMLGTKAMQDDALAGLVLPLKILVHARAEGGCEIAYETPAAMLGRFGGVSPDAPYLAKMAAALAKLAQAAA